MSFFLAYGAEKLASTVTEHKRRQHHQKLKREGGTIPLPSFWEDVLYQLKHNDLIELRLGWHDSQYIPCIRSLSALSKALRNNTSLRRVNIGYKWHRRRDLLLQLLVTLADSIRPHQLQSIQLVLTNDIVPASVLSRLLQSQTSLSSLILQTLTMQNLVWKGMEKALDSSSLSSAGTNTSMSETTSSSRFATSTSRHTTESNRRQVRGTAKRLSKDGQHSLTTTPNNAILVPLVLDSFIANYQYQVMTELRLVDCDLDDKGAILLAEGIIATSILSVRGNRLLSGQGAASLISSDKSMSLDLSLCDFDAVDFATIAEALRTRNTPLQELLLRGNYRMELCGLQDLFQVCPCVVQSLDLSYCDISENMTIYIFKALMDHVQKSRRATSHDAALPFDSSSSFSCAASNHIVLQELSIHGCRIGGIAATDALVALLHQNSSPLRALGLEDDKNDRKYISKRQMHSIAEAMRNNYEMESLTFDFFKNRDEQRIWKEIEFWQSLNRGGRRVLRPALFDSTGAPDSSKGSVAKALREDMDCWIKLVDTATTQTGLEPLYWVIRNSAGRFGGH